MADNATYDLDLQLSQFRGVIEREKLMVENRFDELKEAFLVCKNHLIEKLDGILEQMKKRIEDYKKLIDGKKHLEESLKTVETEESLNQCFARITEEIAKKKPDQTAPDVKVNWNVGDIFENLKKICDIKVIGEWGNERRTKSYSSQPSETIAEQPREKVVEVMETDNVISKMSNPVMVPAIVSWQKELPTLSIQVIYADNKDGTFTLEWNGDCFKNVNVELSVGTHTGSLLLSDKDHSIALEPFEVKNTASMQELTLHAQSQGIEPISPESGASFIPNIKQKSEPKENKKQSVQLIWKKQYETMSKTIQYVDVRDGSIVLEWMGELFQSQPLEMVTGEHHGMLSLEDNDSLPEVQLFTVQITSGVQEVQLNTPKQ